MEKIKKMYEQRYALTEKDKNVSTSNNGEDIKELKKKRIEVYLKENNYLFLNHVKNFSNHKFKLILSNTQQMISYAIY